MATEMYQVGADYQTTLDTIVASLRDSVVKERERRESLIARGESLAKRYRSLDDSLARHASGAAFALIRGDTTEYKTFARATENAYEIRDQGKELLARAESAGMTMRRLEAKIGRANEIGKLLEQYVALAESRLHENAAADSAANHSESEADSASFAAQEEVFAKSFRASASANTDAARLYADLYAQLYQDSSGVCNDSTTMARDVLLPQALKDTIRGFN